MQQFRTVKQKVQQPISKVKYDPISGDNDPTAPEPEDRMIAILRRERRSCLANGFFLIMR
jgi:hypothetical protein